MGSHSLSLYLLILLQSFVLFTAKQSFAVSSDTPSATEVEDESSGPSVPVVFREKAAFRLFYKTDKQKSSNQDRALKASQALEKALTVTDPLQSDAKLVDTVLLSEEKFEVRVRGYKIMDLSIKDALRADVENLEDYREEIITQLNGFIEDEFYRIKIQRMALQFFLSVFFAFMGFVVFRKIRGAFNQADEMVDSKRDSFKPFIFLNENLVSGQTLGNLLAIFLVVARIFTYIVVSLTTLAAVLGQFRASRDIMGKLLKQLVGQTLQGIQSFFEAIPGLLLATILLFTLYLGIKFLNLFLKGVGRGRVTWVVKPNHIPIFRFWGTILLAALILPLTVAALFGRFFSPPEVILLVLAAVLGLATLPIFASLAAGSFILWTENLKPGQWVRIGETSGEITHIDLHKITLVPENGGRVYVPMLQMIYMSCVQNKEGQQTRYNLTIKRPDEIDEILELIQNILPEENHKISVRLTDLGAHTIVFLVELPCSQNLELKFIKAVHSSEKQGRLQLAENGLKELLT